MTAKQAEASWLTGNLYRADVLALAASRGYDDEAHRQAIIGIDPLTRTAARQPLVGCSADQTGPHPMEYRSWHATSKFVT